MLDGYNFGEKENLQGKSEFYIKAFEEYNAKYFDKYNYILENYLVNLFIIICSLLMKLCHSLIVI